MADDKKLLSNLEEFSLAAGRVAKRLDKVSDDLSNTGVDKLTDNIKKYLKQQGMLTAEQEAMIGSMHALSKHIEDLDGGYEKLIKREKELVQGIHKLAEGVNVGREAFIAQLEANDDALKQTREEIAIRKQQIEGLQEHIDATRRGVMATDGFSKAVQKNWDSVKSQGAQMLSFGTGVKMMADAAKQAYEDMNTYTQRGLLGAFSTMSIVSKNLLMTAKEFSEIINKNRDIVNILGGGAKGIEAFGREINSARAGLEYMGKEGYKAAARFVEMNKNLGLTSKDGVAYTKAMNATKDQFKKFAGLFGDSYDEFAALIETQEQEENQRRRLNNMSKDQLATARQEILARTENLKLMGLSNQEIMEFNKRTEEMNNPRKSGQIGTRAVESVAAKNLVQMLVNSGTQEGGALAGHQGALNEYFDARQRGDQIAMKNFEGSDRGAQALAAFSKARGSTDRMSQEQREVYNRVQDMSGTTGNHAIEFGDKIATNKQRGTYQLDNPNLAEIRKNAEAMQQGLDPRMGDLGKRLDELSKVVETVKSILNDPFTKALLGAGIAVASLAYSAIKAARALDALAMGGGGANRPAGTPGGKGTLGGRVMRGVGVGMGLGVAGEALDFAGDYATDNGHESAGSALNIAGSAAKWAGTGAFLGSVIPGVGTVAGAAVGGLVGAGIGTYDYMQKGKGPGSSQAPAAVQQQQQSGSINLKGMNAQQSAAYLASVSKTESGGDYGVENQYGYLGKYQFGADALADAGIIDSSKLKAAKSAGGFNQKSFLANSSNWVTPGGKEAFLKNPALQDKIFEGYTNNNIKGGFKSGALNDSSSPEQVAAYAKAAHLKGVGGANNYFLRGVDSTDANGTKVSTYAAQAAAAVTNVGGGPAFTGGMPTPIAGIAADGATGHAAMPPINVSSNDPNSKTMVAILEKIETNTRNGSKPNGYQQAPGTVAQHVGS